MKTIPKKAEFNEVGMCLDTSLLEKVLSHRKEEIQKEVDLQSYQWNVCIRELDRIVVSEGEKF